MCFSVTRQAFREMMISGQNAEHLELKTLGRPNALDNTIEVEKVHLDMVLASSNNILLN